MKKWLPYIGVFMLGLFIGVGAGGAETETEPTGNLASSTLRAENDELRAELEELRADNAPDEVEAEPVEVEEPVEEADGEFGLASCDVDLSFDGEDRLLGSTEVKNTGNVPLTAEVRFKWLLGDGSKIDAQPKTVKLNPGKDKLVFFQAPAPGNTVSLFQDHPKYFDSENCKTNALIK
jgi:hypothetical protein